jgi:hypothetical protein
MQTIAAGAKTGNLDDQDYNGFLHRFAERAAARIQNNVLFTTDVQNLWDIYLDSFHEESRQHHNCHACQRFIETYGGIVTIGTDGVSHPILWEKTDGTSDLADPIGRMCDAVAKAKVTGVFLSSEKVWGQPVTGIWRHLSVENPKVFTHALYKAHQVAAEKTTEYATVSKCLSEFTLDQLEEAVRILDADALDRSEKTLGQAVWLRDLARARMERRPRQRTAITWLAVATAPTGFCHPRASMISTLLDDLAVGMSFEEVAARWQKKMHPLRYQRPQALPKDGAIKAAEEIVAKLGTAGSLARRFALLEDVPVRLWTPAPPAAPVTPAGGVFGRLRPSTQSPSVTLPEQRMTWEKFASSVLPTADRLEFGVPREPQNYGVFTTAVNPDAPPIFQWDSPDRRNPIAWYVWMGGSPAYQFGLTVGSWVDVLAITEKPPHLYDTKIAHHNRGLMLVLQGAKDTKNKGSGIFPECLLSDYHPIKSVIEKFSNTDMVGAAPEGQLAQGLILDKGHPWNTLLRITSKGKTALYRLDRWD